MAVWHILETQCPQIGNGRAIAAHNGNIWVLEGILEGLETKPDRMQFQHIDMQIFHGCGPPLLSWGGQFDNVCTLTHSTWVCEGVCIDLQGP